MAIQTPKQTIINTTSDPALTVFQANTTSGVYVFETTKDIYVTAIDQRVTQQNIKNETIINDIANIPDAVQFNTGGNFTADQDFTYNAQTDTLSIKNLNLSNGVANLGTVANIKIGGGQDGYVLQTDGDGNLSWVASASGNGSVGGANTQVQFNDGGNFSGNTDFTFNKTNGLLTIKQVLTNAVFSTDGVQIDNGGIAHGETSGVSIPENGNTITPLTAFNNYGNVVVTAGQNPSTLVNWVFDSRGNLTLPGNVFTVNYANGTQVPVGTSTMLTNLGNKFLLDSTGNVVFQGNVSGQGINRGMVWDFGANVSGVNSEIRQDNNGVTVRAWTEQGGGTNGFSAPVRIVTNQDGAENRWIFDGTGNLTLPGDLKLAAGNIQSNATSPLFNSAITGITTGSPTVLVTISDELFEGPDSGTVTISGVVGTTEANGTWGYQAVDTNQFRLYFDSTLSTPVDGSSWTSYISGGTAISAGEYSNLSIQGGNVTIGSNSNTWIFGSDGNLTIPNDILSNTTIDIDNRASGNTADIRLYAADDITLQSRDRDPGSGTEGGDINLYAGDSADDGDASGGDVQIFAGNGGAANVDFGGQGGFIRIQSGDGGAAIGDGVSVAEDGGDITIQAGSAGDNNGNIDRGAGAGDVFILSGASTGNGISGGNIIISTGSGGANGSGGAVEISTPPSDRGDGGTWRFDGSGNLILPSIGNINGADGAWVRIQSLESGNVRSGMILNPGDGLTRLESWDNQGSAGYGTSDWSSGLYVDNNGVGEIAFLNAPTILNFVNSVETSRMFLQVNGGDLLPYQGYGSSGQNITFSVATPPSSSPTTVNSFAIYYSNRSRIEMDYDEGEMNFQSNGLDINIQSDQSIDVISRDIIRLQNSGNTSGVAIITDSGNTFRTWTFNVDGSLEFPDGSNISGGNFNAGSPSATVGLNAFSPSGDTVKIQAQGNTSSAVISIFSNAGPVTSNWTFTTAPLDPSESFLYIPNGGAISTPDATGGEGGKNIFIQAGASDPVTWNSNPGGELMLKGGYGSFGDGGGGAGGNVNIEGGPSSDSHAGNVNISSGLNTWVFDYNGNLNLPPSGNIVGVTANNNGHLNWVGNSSGDGAGYTTLRLVPDDTREGSDQYLIIDPTAPGHIHIRAGGTQDNSDADLFLGGENSYFKVASGANSEVQVTSNNNAWIFNTDGNLQVPGNINGDNSAPLVIDGASSGEGFIRLPNASFGGEQVTIVNQFSLGNGIALTTNGGTWHFGNSGALTAPGNITASNFIGNISITGNVQGTSANVQLVAGSYTATFDNTGVLTLPTIGGDEGGEINFGIPTTNTTLVGPVKFDVFQNRIRFFDGSTKGAYIDLSQAATNVGTLLNNRVSGFVDAGTFVTMDNIRATVTGSTPRGLSLATVSGSFSYNIGGTYASSGVGNGGSSAGGQTLTTTPTSSIFGWGFTVSGDIATYTITDTTNNRCYRITLQIGASFNNNSIIIERLI